MVLILGREVGQEGGRLRDLLDHFPVSDTKILGSRRTPCHDDEDDVVQQRVVEAGPACRNGRNSKFFMPSRTLYVGSCNVDATMMPNSGIERRTAREGGQNHGVKTLATQVLQTGRTAYGGSYRIRSVCLRKIFPPYKYNISRTMAVSISSSINTSTFSLLHIIGSQREFLTHFVSIILRFRACAAWCGHQNLSFPRQAIIIRKHGI